MKTNDSDDRVIDVDFSGAKQKEQRKARKRKLLILVACLLAAAAVLAAVLVFQIVEVTEDKDFWQNFNSLHSERG